MLQDDAQRTRHLCVAQGDGRDCVTSIVWVVVSILLTAISAALGWAVNGLSVGFWAPLFSHAVQWVVCIVHAFPFQTEKYYDLTGSITYILLSLGTLLLTVGTSRTVHPRQVVATSLVIVWALRLGSFLFARIRRDSKDSRFDKLKPYFVAFLGTWSIQGAWCYITGLAVWGVNARDPSAQRAFGWLDGLGIATWILGFGIECLADNQKSRWRTLPSSKGRYIDVGLWRYSRHPNYFGEFVLWCGQFILCASAFVSKDSQGVFDGAGWLTALSPVFVYLLLNYVSGVPILETKSDERWGNEEAYRAYKRETWSFWLLPTRRTTASQGAAAAVAYSESTP